MLLQNRYQLDKALNAWFQEMQQSCMDLTCIHEASCGDYDKIYVFGVDISRAICSIFPVISDIEI